MKLRSERAIRAEYKAVENQREKLMRRKDVPRFEVDALGGALQALAWALNDHAMHPSLCYPANKAAK